METLRNFTATLAQIPQAFAFVGTAARQVGAAYSSTIDHATAMASDERRRTLIDFSAAAALGYLAWRVGSESPMAAAVGAVAAVAILGIVRARSNQYKPEVATGNHAAIMLTGLAILAALYGIRAAQAPHLVRWLSPHILTTTGATVHELAGVGIAGIAGAVFGSASFVAISNYNSDWTTS